MPNVLNPISGRFDYKGVNFVNKTRAPTTSDYDGYSVPTIWVHDQLNQAYILVNKDSSTQTSTWIEIGSTGFDFYDSVLSIADCTAAPPTETTGARYIVDNTAGTVNAAWDGASKNDLAEFDGTVWVSTTPTKGGLCYVEDVSTLYVFDGSSWNSISASIPNMTTSVIGVGELATDAEAIAGSLTDYHVINPGSLKAALQSPTTIGSTTPNTGSFTTLTATNDGTSGATDDIATLTNTTATVTDGGSAVLWKLRASDTNDYDAGRIAVLGDGTWSGTASTRDSHMSFYTSENGSVGECIRLTSDKKILTIGTKEFVLEEGTIELRETVGGNKRLMLGFSSSDYGWIDAVNAGSSSLPFAIQPGKGRTGIGTSDPSSFVDIEGRGTAKTTLDVLELTNTIYDSDMDGTGTAIYFRQWYYDVTTPAVADSGRIACITETDWTSTASTRDSYLSFQTALDGSVSEKMCIKSNAFVGINQSTPAAYLHVTGEGAASEQSSVVINNDIAPATNPNNAKLTIGNTDGVSELVLGQLNTNNLVFAWKYNATAGDAWAQIETYGGNNHLLFMANGDSNIGIGIPEGSLPTSKLDVQKSGTVKVTTDIVEITNSGNAADMDGTGTGILFNQWYYDGATPAVADAGRIACITETDWTSTASTQDSYLSFQTCLDGSVAEKMSLSSKGVTKIGSGTIDTTAAAVHTIFNGTEPGGAVTDGIQIYAKDTTDNTSALALYTEQAVEAGAPTPSHKLKVWINGTAYWLSLDAV